MYCTGMETAIFYLEAERDKIFHYQNAHDFRSCKLVTKDDSMKKTGTDRRIDNGKSGKTT